LFLSLSRGMKVLVSGAGANDDHARSFNEAHSHAKTGIHFC
jgi:hypothetical protein